MLDDVQHPLWQDTAFHKNLQQQLGESYQACVAAVTLTQQTLDRVLAKYGGLGILVDRSLVSLFVRQPGPQITLYVGSLGELKSSQPRQKATRAFSGVPSGLDREAKSFSQNQTLIRQ